MPSPSLDARRQSMVVAQTDAVSNNSEHVKVNGKAIKSKNQLRRLKQKQKKQAVSSIIFQRYNTLSFLRGCLFSNRRMTRNLQQLMAS